jgi:hypothetical protein
MGLALTIGCSSGHSLVPPYGGGACRLDLDAASLTGTWDPRFTIPGFTGPDGRAPTVYDFARDIDGSIVALLRDGGIAPVLALSKIDLAADLSPLIASCRQTHSIISQLNTAVCNPTALLLGGPCRDARGARPAARRCSCPRPARCGRSWL